MIPMNKASEMSRRVPAPKTKAPMNKIAATGRTATIEVLMERTSVWFTARLTRSAKVAVSENSTSKVFSRILSKTTTVS
jgi:hypothetical protein